MRPATYEIRIDGTLPAEELGEFVGMRASYETGRTVLRGVIPDQAALAGLVARVEALGCAVRELRVLSGAHGEGKAVEDERRSASPGHGVAGPGAWHHGSDSGAGSQGLQGHP
jgi:hypothetical protein